MSKAEKVLQILKSSIKLDHKRFVVEHARRDPFEALVAIVLSQNTNDRNAIRALEALRERGLFTPEAIEEAELTVLEEAVRPAGMHRQRARRLKELAVAVEGKDLLSLGREELMALPGVGPKTADVFLSFMGLSPEFPIDTHVRRVVSRLSLAKGGYESMRRALLRAFPPDERVFAHLALIEVGRRWCRPRNPRCGECPLREVCEYANPPQSSSSSSRVSTPASHHGGELKGSQD
ncbi:MAG: endonuclease III [Thermoplasmata archaeon]|nr:endonuclease III [Thermoplasmata archaeon]